MHHRLRSIFVSGGVALAALGLAACGGGGDTATSSDALADSGDEAAADTDGGQAPALDSCTVVSPEQIEAAFGVSGAEGELGPGGDCLWSATGEGSMANTKYAPESGTGIDLSGLIDETTVTVPIGDQGLYDTEAKCIETIVDESTRVRMCSFLGDDPKAALEALLNDALATIDSTG